MVLSIPSDILAAIMRHLRIHSLRPLLLLTAAMLLRGFVPAGYMPAAAGSGFLFEFCPEGVPAGFMQVLSGDTGQSVHQHGHDHGDESGDGHHCPIGHMLSSAAAVDDAQAADIVAAPRADVTVTPYYFTIAPRANYEPRGPPA